MKLKIYAGIGDSDHLTRGAPTNGTRTMKDSFRLSRISHPRASLWAMALLAVVFAAFGVWAEAAVPMLETANEYGSALELLTFYTGIFG